MLSKKIYRYLIYLCSISSVLLFLFWHIFVNYADTVANHYFLEQGNSWQAHWNFLMKLENMYVFIFFTFLSFIPLLLIYLVDKWLYPKWKSYFKV